MNSKARSWISVLIERILQPSSLLLATLAVFALANGANSGPLGFVRKGAWPGYPRANPVAVTLAGGFAYVAAQRGVIVFDLSVPTNPVPVGGFTGEISYVAEVCVVSNYLYVAGGLSGLHILSITNPAQPVQVGWYQQASSQTSARSVQVVDHYAYVANDLAGITVIDVADPEQPIRVGGYDTFGRATEIQVVGSIAYVADYSGGLVILNVSDPANPVRLGGYDTPGTASRVFVHGHHAYVSDGFSGIQIIDVADPAKPLLVGSYTNGSYIGAVRVVGSKAYVATDASAELVVLDLSNPANPVEISRTSASLSSPTDVRVQGHYAYVTDYGDLGAIGTLQGRLHVFDVSNPTNVLRVGGHADIQGSTRDVHVSGNVAYLADDVGGMSLVDVADPSAPVATSSFTSSLVNAVHVVGETAFVAGSKGLEVVAVSNRFQPLLISRRGPWANDVQVVNHLAYVAVQDDVLRVYDWSNPANPLRVDDYDEESDGLRLAISGSLGAVLTSDGGLQIVDLADPTDPSRIASPSLGIVLSGDVALAGHHAYVADGSERLRIFDLQNPSVPVELDAFTLTNAQANAIRVVGTRAYLGGGSAGLIVLDVSDPSHPLWIGSYKTPVPVFGLHVAEPFVYLAQGIWGMLILEMTTPALSISRANHGITISWSPNDGSMVLEEIENLTTGSWSVAPSGTNNGVTLPVDRAKSFYRLRAYQPGQ